MPGCGAPGEYRAPRSRQTLNDYWWFCLEHVRAYNASWDFYKGMSPEQIEAHLRSDTAWQRPTWPLGRLGAGTFDEAMLHDPLHVLDAARVRPQQPPARQAPADLREPLATLGLAWPLSMASLKTRYKQLAKQHHPDANNGDKVSEERLKTINLAYSAVRGRLQAEPKLAAAS